MKADQILRYASGAAGALTAIPVPGVQLAAGIAQGLLGLGAMIAANEADPLPHVERIRDQWPTVRAAMAKADQLKQAEKAKPLAH